MSVPSEEPTDDGPKRRRLLALVVALVGLVGLGFIGFRLTRSVSSEFVGGAPSPEGAVEQFTDSINNEDILGAFTYIAPDEVDGVADVLEALMGTLDAGAGGIGDGSEADVNLELTGLSATREGDHAAIVEFEISGGVERGATTGPIGVALPASSSFDADDLEDLFGGSGGEIQLVTVELGGNWYVSPMLSFGNLVTELNDLESGDFDRVGEERPGGGSDPQDAVDQMFQALADFDVDDLAASLGGGEGRFVYVFTDAIDELVDDIPPDVSAEVDTRLSLLDDGQVEVDEVEGSLVDDTGVVDFAVKGDCLSVSDEYDSARGCLLDDIPFDSSVDDTIVLHTVEEDGATRVRLVPTAADVASRLVAASSRQLLIYAVGLEWADAATTVAAGSDTDISFDGNLYDVYEFEAAAGGRFSVDTDEGDLEVWVREGDGPWDRTWREVVEPDGDALVRVVVYSEVDCGDDRCFPSGGGDDTLRIRTVPRQAAAFPSVLSGELGPGDQIVFDLTVTEGQAVQIGLTGGADVWWNTDDGPWDYLNDAVYGMEPGEYSLVIGNDGDSVESYELVPSVPTVGFGGASDTTGSLSSGGFVADLEVVAGMWSVTATPSDNQDIVLIIDDVNCFADEGFEGDEERCYFETSSAEFVQVEVVGYGSSDGFGTVELSLG